MLKYYGNQFLLNFNKQFTKLIQQFSKIIFSCKKFYVVNVVPRLDSSVN